MYLLIRIFEEVLYLGAMACVVIVLLLAVKRLFRKALSPKWQYYLWAVLLLRLLIPFQPPSALSIYTVLYDAAVSVEFPVASIAEPLKIPAPAGNASGSGQNAPDSPASNGTPGNQASVGSANRPETPDTAGTPVKAAAVAWLAGMAALGLYTVIINAAFAAGVRRRYAPLRDDRVARILKGCRDDLCIRRDIPVLAADKARAPALYGLIRPKLLVGGATMEKLSDDELRHVFLHELSHYKRKDIATNWLMTVLQIVYFFNPLVWYAFHKIREDGEIACDAAALSYIKASERQAYGGTILKLIRLLSESSFIPVTAGISKNKSSAKRRILMISNFKKSTRAGALLAIILIAAVALLGMTGCSKTLNAPPDKPSPGANAASASDPGGAPDGAASASPSASPVPEAGTAPAQDTANPSPAPSAAKPYYGSWTVSKVLAYGAAGTYGQEDAEKLVGKTLSFSDSQAEFINDQPSASPVSSKNPSYQESAVSKSDFLTSFRMSFDKLGITADSVTEVDVSVKDAGGCTLLLKDGSTLILTAGGTYFELVRA
jgi:beta-lactamase regulating signal transducer with metallopeptidase domain